MGENNVDKDISQDRSLQDYLSLGYLYLLVLGIIKDAIFYGYLGVNIINYASIQDILLSPIIHLTSNIKSFLLIFVGIPLIAFVVGYLAKKYHNYNKNKEWYKAKKNYETYEQIYGEKNNYGFMITLVLLTLFGAFIGAGLGGGQKIAKKLKAQELEINRQIVFTNDNVLPVNLLGHNSEYLFCATEKDTVVTIIPIQGNVKKILNQK